MTVLAVDTSARRRSVCVLASDDGALLEADVRHDSKLDGALPVALARLMGPEVGSLVVVVGPGSYTGLRTGLAMALGVAHARELPLFGAGSLEVVAAGAVAGGAERGWAVADAGRGALYVTRFGPSSAAAEPATRVSVGAFDRGHLEVYVIDSVPIAAARTVDPSLALARVVPVAMSRPELPRTGLQATYAD